MIEFFPVVKLRELGRQLEMKDLSAFVESRGFDTVEHAICGVFYRFFCDMQCPAVFVKLPEEGDSPVDGLTWLRDYGADELTAILDATALHCAERYGYDCAYDASPMGRRVLLVIKDDFKEGGWVKYGFEYAGKDGVSIPA